MKYRIEKDSMGEVKVPEAALWGSHTQRALENFSVSSRKVPGALINALAVVKKACCMANLETGYITGDKAEAIIKVCDEIARSEHAEQFPLDALQGGAGTSTNMNMNEVIANRALEIMGNKRGDHSFLHPIDDVNMHQSTNDVYPTALKVAIIAGLRGLADKVEKLQGAFQRKEKEFAGIVKIGRTERVEAAPMTLGAEFSAFAEAIARDRWRVFKCEERIRTVNIGGTAVGTGLTAPRSYIFLVIEKLRELTGFGLTRAENTVDHTANSDTFVEVAGILKAHASNLIKISNDLRMLNMLGELRLPAMQAGSSIMPGKVNPVILESAVQASIQAAADCDLVFDSAARGSMQINEFLPLLSVSILEALEVLGNVDEMLKGHIEAIVADEDMCMKYLEKNPRIITAFVPSLGYERCEELLKEFQDKEESGGNIREFLEGKLGKGTVDKLLSADSLMALGYRDEKSA